MRLTHKQEYKDKRKNREPMLKIRNKLFNYENVEEKHKILSLDDLDNRLTALEVINDKDVSPIDIRCCDTVEQYNVKENGNIPLTQEEFDLLKRYCYEKED